MNARFIKLRAHVGAGVEHDNPTLLALLNDRIRGMGVILELQPKEWEPPGGLMRPPRNPFSRSRRRK